MAGIVGDAKSVDEDARLMLLAAAGDTPAFERLYRKYLQLVQLYLRGLGGKVSSVPDMAQEVFTRVWARRGQYMGESTFKTYLLGYAKKVFLEEQRRQRRDRALPEHISKNLSRRGAPSTVPELEIEDAELRESLGRAIAGLTVEQREAIRLYYVDQMSLEKAAQAARCTRKAFASRLLRARRELRNAVKSSR